MFAASRREIVGISRDNKLSFTFVARKYVYTIMEHYFTVCEKRTKMLSYAAYS